MRYRPIILVTLFLFVGAAPATAPSWNTIRKYLRSDAVEVRFKVTERPSRLDPFADRLSEWLRLEASKGRKVRRTVRQLHAIWSP